MSGVLKREKKIAGAGTDPDGQLLNLEPLFSSRRFLSLQSSDGERLWAFLCSVFLSTRWPRNSGWSAHRTNDPLQALAKIVNRTGEHGTGNLKENEAEPGST
jgi:hypothetical protein